MVCCSHGVEWLPAIFSGGSAANAALLSPPALGATPNTQLANLLGLPAISLPLGVSPAGLPVGTQWIAPFGREDVLFRLAGQLEAAHPWIDRRPGILESA